MQTIKNKRNPILPLEHHVPDGEAHVMPDGRLYIYGSYDEHMDEFCSDKYHVVSTSDMENWVIHEQAFSGKDVPWFFDPDAPRYPGVDWSRPTPFIQKMMKLMEDSGYEMPEEPAGEATPKQPFLFAPDCIERKGTYYLYFCLSDDSEGVAVSKHPEGPFTNPVQLPCGGIDPAVFIDDDGQTYYYWGQFFSHGVKLNEDMVSFDRDAVVENLLTEEEHYFHEGSSMRKIGDTYYYVYADMERGKPTALGYATGSSPLGPFRYRGIIIDNDGCDPASWNNHGSIECVNGRWYVFYHRCSRGGQRFRRLCIEPITIRPDGTIGEVKMTSQGVGEPFAPGETIYGYQACGLRGTIYIGMDEEKGERLVNISSGDEAIFRYVKSGDSFHEITLSGSGSGIVQIKMNDAIAGEVVFDADTGQRQVTSKLSMPAGEYELTLAFVKSDQLQIMEIQLS